MLVPQVSHLAACRFLHRFAVKLVYHAQNEHAKRGGKKAPYRDQIIFVHQLGKDQ